MKRRIATWCLIAAGLGLTNGVNATEFTTGGIKYSVVSEQEGTVSVVSAEQTDDGVVVIPEFVDNGEATYAVTEIGYCAFRYDLWMVKLVMPNSIIKIEESALERCEKLKEVTFSTGLKTLGASMCYACKSLETPIVIPEGVTEVPDGCFSSCYSIPSVTFHDNVKTIGAYAFSTDSELGNVTIPASVTSIGEAPFTACYSMESITVAAGNKNYCDIDGVLYNIEKTSLIQCPAGRTEPVFVVPETVKLIGRTAFLQSSNIQQIIVPNSVTKIDAYAFQYCRNLRSIILPESLEKISQGMFYGCTSLPALTLPRECTSIGERTFGECYSLLEVVIDSKVKTIGSGAFDGGREMTQVIVRATVPPTCLGTNTFNQPTFDNATLVVPAGTVETYKNAEMWKQFANIVAASDQSDCVDLIAQDDVITLKMQSEVFIPIKVENRGNNTVNSIGYCLDIDGNNIQGTLDNTALMPNNFGRFTIPVTTQQGEHSCTLTLESVNGASNNSEAKTISFTLKLIDKAELPKDAPMFTYANFGEFRYFGNGSRQYDRYQGAMKFVEPDFVGWKVVGMTVKGLDAVNFGNFKVWSSSSLNNINGETVDASVGTGEITGAFFNPFTIDNDGLYFGFTMDRLSAEGTNWPIPFATYQTTNDHGFYAQVGDGPFDNQSDYGALPVILYLQGPNKANSVKLVSIDAKALGFKDNTVDVPVTLSNMGGNAVDNVEFSYTLDGETHAVSTTLSNPMEAFIGQLKQNVFTLEPKERAGAYEVEMKVSKVNGDPNNYQQEPLKFNLTLGEFPTVHNPIVEEFTGTGCGFCSRGTLGMSQMTQTVPGFIGVAYHRFNSSDPMYLTDGIYYVGSFPSAFIDRNGIPIDPYYGANGKPMGIKDVYAAAKRIAAPADLSLKTQWAPDSTQITATVTYRFSYAEAGETYKLGFILTIDSLSHPSEPSWKQNNSYADTDFGLDQNDMLLQTICDGTFDLTVYNHVVIDQSAAHGLKDLKADEITIGAEGEFSVLFSGETSLANQETIERKDIANIHVVAILLDRDGHIRNAVEALAGHDSAENVGVTKIIPTGDVTAVYYDLMGRRVNNPRGGIFIKVSGNKAEKIAM